jgi:hypothetical protein
VTEVSLFIGVVSHEGSRFAISQGPEGLAHQLAAVMPNVIVEVNVADLLEAGSPLVSPAGVQRSLTAEARVEQAWSRFLDRPRDLDWWRFSASRMARRVWQKLRPPSPQMLRRLLNIELSHLNLMRQGLASGAPWVLILEDDAFASKVSDLSSGLLGVIGAAESSGTVGYVNLSESFTARHLGIEHLLEPTAVTWTGSISRAIVSVRKPVTNTVCAILYSSTFLAKVVEAMESLSMDPVVPIDWKLNMALMALFEGGEAPAGTCWLVEPAPIAQMSMRSAEILTP